MKRANEDEHIFSLNFGIMLFMDRSLIIFYVSKFCFDGGTSNKLVYMVNYIFKQIHIENFFYKILFSFIETHSLTNENPYRRSLSLRRHTYVLTLGFVPKISLHQVSFILAEIQQIICKHYTEQGY